MFFVIHDCVTVICDIYVTVTYNVMLNPNPKSEK